MDYSHFWYIFAAKNVNDMVINLSDIALGMPGISPVVGADLMENCATMLHRCGHATPTQMGLSGMTNESVTIYWEDNIDDQIERSHADTIENTELSAVCLSVLITRLLTEYTIVSRSRIGTGFDYWLGKKEDPLFTPLARLEISGIEKETQTNTMDSRYKQKKKQVAVSDGTGLPAYISIIEFGTPKALFNQEQ